MNEAVRTALAHGLCHPPGCGGSLRPWAPLIVPPSLSGRVLDILLGALVALDEDYLREHPETPELYKAGVWYEAEPPGQEQWLTIPWCLVRRDVGRGVDCEDLAGWRTAELRVRQGEPAEAFWVESKSRGHRVYHIRVRRKRGGKVWVEDPSVVLGMGRLEPGFDSVGWASHWGEGHGIVDGERA